MTESTVERIVHVKDITGGPGALGILGYGLPIILVSLANAGIIESGSMILGMIIFYGGIAQFTAGMMEWKKGNTFGLTAYGSYGLFWLSYAALLILPELGLATGIGGSGAMAAYLAIWGIFTVLLFIGSLRMSRALQFVLVTLALVFFLEAAGAGTGITEITLIAGYVGIISGFSAIYTAFAPIMNNIYGKVIAPLG